MMYRTGRAGLNANSEPPPALGTNALARAANRVISYLK
jgi:hypothetical protein